jgi:aspartate carbamoyltransferase
MRAVSSQAEEPKKDKKIPPFSLRHQSIVSSKQFTAQDVEYVCAAADRMATVVGKMEYLSSLRGHLVALVFFQESTRTRLSFEAAVKRLGGSVVSIIGPEFSSMAKGESFEDTIRAIAASVNIVIIRHKEMNSAVRAAEVAGIPVFNGGDGPGEHPTQALLDFYTIRNELFEGPIPENAKLNVAFVGDLKHGRTIHSLARLIAPFPFRVMCVSPDSLSLPHELEEELVAANVRIERVSFEQAVREADVLYMTRVQREHLSEEERTCPDPYILTPELLRTAKERMRVLHPFPRNTEIDPRCDTDPRSAYFRQMKNALPVRMALLELVVGLPI